MKRPLGVKIIGGIVILSSIFHLFSLVAWVIASDAVAPYVQRFSVEERKTLSPGQAAALARLEQKLSSPGFRQIRPIDVSILLFRGCFGLTVGIALLLLKNWVRWLVIVASGFSTGLLCLSALIGFGIPGTLWSGSQIWLPLSTICKNILVLWYFLRPSVKAQFVRQK